MTTQTLSTTQLAALPRVNLLPPEIAEKARARKLQAGMGAAVAASVVGVVAGYLMAHSGASSAQSDLSKSQAETTRLQTQVAQYAGDESLRTQLTAEQGMLSSAMGQEIQWSHYLNDLTLRIPDNVWITQMTISEGGAAGSTAPASGAASSSGIGSVSVSGVAFTHDDVATWLDSLAKEKGYANPYFQNSAESFIGARRVVNFTSSTVVTSDALSGRYTRPAGELTDMDKMKQWALLTLVAILAIAVGGWFVLISPQRSHASDLRTQRQSQESHNAQLRNQIASLQSQHKGLPQVQAELAKLGVQLPSNPALPALIRSLSSAADAAGVDLISLAPQAPTAASAPAAAATASPAPASSSTSSSSSASTSSAPAAAANAGALQNIPITVVVNGGYFQVEQFVSNLEALTRPFLTTGITMAPQAPIAPAAAATATSGATAPASTSGTTTSGYEGHVQATISGQVFMVSGTSAAPSTATK